MRRLAVAAVALVTAAGCGGLEDPAPPVTEAMPATAGRTTAEPPPPSTPEAVVLDWSDALNHGLNDDAAGYFAPETTVVAEDGTVLVLRGHDQATAFNASIACQGRIIGLSRHADRIWAAFILDQRGTFACPAPGVIDTARFTVEGDLIVRFEDLPD
jgi:hypothetical protein